MIQLERFSVALLLAVTFASSVAARPMNILGLYADDWRFDTLGVAGNPIVQTPNLDRLANQGLRFTQVAVTTSICGVSRATLFTGQWMARHGNNAFGPFKTPWAETYPGLLRANGYWVGHVGKWHNGKFPGDKFDFGRDYAGEHWLTGPDGRTANSRDEKERGQCAGISRLFTSRRNPPEWRTELFL